MDYQGVKGLCHFFVLYRENNHIYLLKPHEKHQPLTTRPSTSRQS